MGGMISMMWSGGIDVIEGRMTGGELGAFVFYAVMVGTSFATLAEVWGDLQRAAGASERLMELLQESNTIPDSGSSAIASGQCLHFDAVQFFYPSRPDIPALNGFNLTIQPGESVALVGPSGAGKSTVFELVLRFYDPAKGAIEFGGTDLRALSLTAWRQKIALVPQQPALFSGDILYNIAYGADSPTQASVETAAQMAHASRFHNGPTRGLPKRSWRTRRQALRRPTSTIGASKSYFGQSRATAARRSHQCTRYGKRVACAAGAY